MTCVSCLGKFRCAPRSNPLRLPIPDSRHPDPPEASGVYPIFTNEGVALHAWRHARIQAALRLPFLERCDCDALRRHLPVRMRQPVRLAPRLVNALIGTLSERPVPDSTGRNGYRR